MVSSSRWTELTTSLKFHASLANVACSPTQFRLLNLGTPVVLGRVDNVGQTAMHAKLLTLLDGLPYGQTPLCTHIDDIVKEVKKLAPELRANGHKAVVVIATDGEASDGNVAQALKPLKNLPVLLMVRLCTDQGAIVEYWNNIDRELELSMDVVDDLFGEAHEIYRHNKWITYGELTGHLANLQFVS